MPDYQTYNVKFPDGYTQSFQAPAGMTDEQAVTRAKQERSIGSGKIQTSFGGGFAKALGQDRGTTGALLTGAGLLGRTPALAASAPMLSRLIQYGTEKATGENPETPSVGQLAGDSAIGALSTYGPRLVAKGVAALGARTIPHQVPTGGMTTQMNGLSGLSQVPAQVWQAGLKGHGVVPWAVREGTQALANGLGAIEPGLSNLGPAVRQYIMQALTKPEDLMGGKP